MYGEQRGFVMTLSGRSLPHVTSYAQVHIYTMHYAVREMDKWGDTGAEYVGWTGRETIPMTKHPDRTAWRRMSLFSLTSQDAVDSGEASVAVS